MTINHICAKDTFEIYRTFTSIKGGCIHSTYLMSHCDHNYIMFEKGFY